MAVPNANADYQPKAREIYYLPMETPAELVKNLQRIAPPV